MPTQVPALTEFKVKSAPVGEHPDGGPISVRAGRFGPYVNHGKVNATLPKSLSPESISLEEAIRLIEVDADSREHAIENAGAHL